MLAAALSYVEHKSFLCLHYCIAWKMLHYDLTALFDMV